MCLGGAGGLDCGQNGGGSKPWAPGGERSLGRLGQMGGQGSSLGGPGDDDRADGVVDPGPCACARDEDALFVQRHVKEVTSGKPSPGEPGIVALIGVWAQVGKRDAGV